RIRQQGYLDQRWANLYTREHMPIDVIISPEREVARAISRRLEVPGAFDMISLVDDQVKMTGIRCGDNCPLINTPLRQLTQLIPDLNVVIIGIIREDEAIVPTAVDELLPGDEVYVVVDAQHVERTLAAFGHEEREARRIV
ncbi:MAG: TrkA C-terminal domain-containing protein, partial [Rhodospirillaceae bacterium]